MILCALCSKAVGLPGCQKREDSLSVSAASGWPVNFYSRIHFQYTHFSRNTNQPICKVSHFTNFVPTHPRFHLYWKCVPWEDIIQIGFPDECPEALLESALPPGIFFFLSTPIFEEEEKIITLQIWLDLFALLAQTLVCTHHSLPKAKRDFICKIPIHKQFRSGRVSNLHFKLKNFALIIWNSNYRISISEGQFWMSRGRKEWRFSSLLTQNEWQNWFKIWVFSSILKEMNVKRAKEWVFSSLSPSCVSRPHNSEVELTNGGLLELSKICCIFK